MEFVDLITVVQLYNNAVPNANTLSLPMPPFANSERMYTPTLTGLPTELIQRIASDLHPWEELHLAFTYRQLYHILSRNLINLYLAGVMYRAGQRTTLGDYHRIHGSRIPSFRGPLTIHPASLGLLVDGTPITPMGGGALHTGFGGGMLNTRFQGSYYPNCILPHHRQDLHPGGRLGPFDQSSRNINRWNQENGWWENWSVGIWSRGLNFRGGRRCGHCCGQYRVCCCRLNLGRRCCDCGRELSCTHCTDSVYTGQAPYCCPWGVWWECCL